LHPVSIEREHSSAGSEHLPYKQRVTGSNPVAPTNANSIASTEFCGGFLFYGLRENMHTGCKKIKKE
jgi:hypothetical protein